MKSAEWNEIKQVFTAAIELSAPERAGFLAAYPPEVQCEVAKLIAADSSAGDFIVEPAVIELGLGSDESADLYLGKQLASYKIISEIGHGGMGAVYLANRADASFDKPVAIKLIKRGMDTTAVLKRFVTERQILARLEHPNIATLLDGGTTADGLPYFVMEYVDGRPITEYCFLRQTPTRERLELFRKVCSAVSFAHQNLIVHRDLKPSNIVVTGDGTPKLLDFGIAKLLNPESTVDGDEATATMFRVMTPEYASPEQIRGLPITTASDVYSLGVVLYELLSGERPYKITSRSPDEVASAVLTAEPLKPSAVISGRRSGNRNGRRVSGVAPETGSYQKDHEQNPKLLRGDLDNIVLKALRKETERRYLSVQEFSEDIRRHIEGLPVTATADSFSYRIGKFVKRHRVGVLAGALMLVSLIGGIAATSWQARRANLEREKAERRFKDVRNLANSFLFDFHDAIADLSGATQAREMVVNKAKEYLDSLAQEAGDDPELLWELSTAYLKLGDAQGRPGFSRTGDTDSALRSYETSLDLRRHLARLAPGNPEYQFGLSVVLSRFGPIFQVLGRPDAAVERMREAMDITDKLLPGSQELAVYEGATRNPAFLGDALAETGRYDEALAMYQKSLSLAEQAPAAFPDKAVKHRIVVAKERLGFIYDTMGDWQRSLDNHLQFLAIEEQLALVEPSNVEYMRARATALDHVGDAYRGLKNYPRAVEYGRRGMALYDDLLRADGQNARAKKDAGDCSHHLAETLIASGDFAGALLLLQKTIGLRRELAALDPTNVEYPDDLANSLVLKGECLEGIKNPRAALEVLEEARDLNEPIVLAHPTRIDYRRGLARLYSDIADIHTALGSRVEAESFYHKALDIWQQLQKQNALWAKDESAPARIVEKLNAVPVKR